MSTRLRPRCIATVAPADGGASRVLTVKTLRDERPARYRERVESNRQRVHQATDGRVGHVHIPDMSPYGYAEFYRGFLAEVVRDGMIVDVRFNGGGVMSRSCCWKSWPVGGSPM